MVNTTTIIIISISVTVVVCFILLGIYLSYSTGKKSKLTTKTGYSGDIDPKIYTMKSIYQPTDQETEETYDI